MGKLTAKQQRFCDEYLIDLNATRAAIEAGYSKKAAKEIGSENLTKPNIAEYIAKRMAEKEDSLIAKQDEVLKYLTRVMRRLEPENTVVVLKNGESKWVTGPDGKPKKVTESWEEAKLVEFPTKVSDANRAAELLGKRYAIWTDKTDISGDVGVQIIDDIGEEDDDDD